MSKRELILFVITLGGLNFIWNHPHAISLIPYLEMPERTINEIDGHSPHYSSEPANILVNLNYNELASPSAPPDGTD